MRNVIIVAAVLAILGVSDIAWAEYDLPSSVQDYISACQKYEHPTTEDLTNFTYCAGTVQGVIVTINALKDWGVVKRPCVPKNTTRGQIIQAFLNWAKDDPKRWQLSGAHGVFIAILETWPSCITATDC